MKDYARSFYKSTEWDRCRAAYIRSVGGLCERCRAAGVIRAGVIVHHKQYIDPENIHNPGITLQHSNLELLCLECHNKEHKRKERRYNVDTNGHVITAGDDASGDR